MKKEIKVNIDGNDYIVEISINEDLKISSVKVDGEIIDIESVSEISEKEIINNNISTKIISEKINNTSTTMPDDIIAPMAGTVLKIEKNIGDTVSQGDLLFVVESMKMEQMITSDFSGKIAAITVNVNDQISAGDALLKFENSNLQTEPVSNQTIVKNDKSNDSSSQNISSPMAGVILKIEKNTGDSISQGDLLIVMESMKMEQMIKSDYDGTIDSIEVSVNDQVLAGQLLIKIK
ncbi:biotin/lipoyl-binding protein [Chloroflexi bacterium]|nr:biotin/lipoyl-binding protein [Chloroflexota bacterium]